MILKESPLDNPEKELSEFKFRSVIQGRFGKLMTIMTLLLPLVNLALTSILVLKVFDYFFRLNLFWIYYFCGLALCLCFIKPYILSWRLYETIKEVITSTTGDAEAIEYPKIPFITVFQVFIRTIFFNVLNDLFILTIFWISFFSILYISGFLILPNDFDFTKFVEVMTLMGILSGFFQFYITSYSQQVTARINDSISKYILKAVRSVSFTDFIRFINEQSKDKNDKMEKLKKRITKIDAEHLKNIIDRYLTQKGRGSPQITQIYYTPPEVSGFAFFEYLDNEETIGAPESENREYLHELYRCYLTSKLDKFKDELKEKDLREVKDLTFTNISFFDQMATSLTKSKFDSSFNNKEFGNFRDHYTKFIEDCVYTFFGVLLDGDT
ncbi:MAG: hypothetical protein U9Q22_06390 [Candidatus Altiarchaeota archaeon]|nr:hypothetical protein [Candidatus Altiarchaeota archaeon]